MIFHARSITGMAVGPKAPPMDRLSPSLTAVSGSWSGSKEARVMRTQRTCRNVRQLKAIINTRLCRIDWIRNLQAAKITRRRMLQKSEKGAIQ